jgi:hypothetical protein
MKLSAASCYFVPLIIPMCGGINEKLRKVKRETQKDSKVGVRPSSE